MTKKFISLFQKNMFIFSESCRVSRFLLKNLFSRINHLFRSLTSLYKTYTGTKQLGGRGGNWGGSGRPCPTTLQPPSHTSISERNKAQKFQFQISRILLFKQVQKFHIFLPCTLHFLGNLWRLFIFLTT